MPIQPFWSRLMIITGILLPLAFHAAPGDTPGNTTGEPAMTAVTAATIEAVVEQLVQQHGPNEEPRIRRCVPRAAAAWRTEDGSADEFSEFCLEQFQPDDGSLDRLTDRYELIAEQVSGYLHEMNRLLREPLDLDQGPIMPLDLLAARLNLRNHLQEDLYANKVAFAILVNLPVYSLEEMIQLGPEWTRREWARARMAQAFSERLPSEVSREISQAFLESDHYISSYNIRMDRLLNSDNQRPFPDGLRLITHWGLRDELKSQYSEPDGLDRQRLIRTVMERIIRQEIPAAVIDNPDLLWAPEGNQVYQLPAEGSAIGTPLDEEREADERYAQLLKIFHAVRLADRWSPDQPTFIQRRFERYRQIPAPEVARLLVSILSSPEAAEVGQLISHRLGRPLEPFDIWYNGFAPRGSHREEELDRLVRERYPDVAAFQADLPVILGKLGFSKEDAEFLAGKIVVDASRGVGHASGAERREDSAHLRTRVGESGMDFKGYNIAVHEFGHNVEQVLTLNRIDHTMLQGVPNTAFTEAFAFIFQDRDLELLGLTEENSNVKHLKALDNFWSVYEIGGVALVDMEVWGWMYDHPEATPAQLREAVIRIAGDIWNRYYAPVFGSGDEILLGVYSHMIDAGLYLPDYPMGHIIAFQVESYMEGKNLAEEMKRMCAQGSITPDAWMRGATGSPISTEPLLAATRKAVAALGE
jgi:hypothetical protein